MQTQQIDTTETTDLDQQIERARAQLAKLRDAADEAATEHSRWQTAFDREPTQQAFTNAAVAKRKAELAIEAAESYERDRLAKLLEQQYRRESAAVEARLAHELAEINAAAAATEHSIVGTIEALDANITTLCRLFQSRQAASASPVSFSQMLADIQSRLLARIRDVTNPRERHRREVFVKFIDNMDGISPFLELSLRRPADVPYHSR